MSKACQMMGVSRDTFYRYQAAREEGGVEALLEKSPGVSRIQRTGWSRRVEQAVLNFALEYPAHGQVRVSNELRKAGDVSCPPVAFAASGYARHVAKQKAPIEGAGSQGRRGRDLCSPRLRLRPLERQRATDEVHGEIETEHPGLPGLSGHVLRRHDQRHRPYLPADVRRHLRQGRRLQAVHDQDADHGCRSSQRSCVADAGRKMAST